ncbi:MAG: RidA family protein [Rhodobacterales bacterium]
MSDIQRINPGPRMSQAVIHNGIIWLAGQVGTPGAPVADQTRDMLASVDALLSENGTSKSRILQATIWLADMADFAEMNAIYDAWIDPANPPTRACSEAALATPDYKVEIIIVAAVDGK